MTSRGLYKKHWDIHELREARQIVFTEKKHPI